MSNAEAIQQSIQAWQEFLSKNDWRELITGVTPKETGCGPVYELPNYLKRPGESLAVARMRLGEVAELHYHPYPDVEIYLGLAGLALVVVGGVEHNIGPGDAVVIPPANAHFTVPKEDFVIAAINIPEFRPDHYITIPTDQDNPEVRFSAAQFERLTASE